MGELSSVASTSITACLALSLSLMACRQAPSDNSSGNFGGKTRAPPGQTTPPRVPSEGSRPGPGDRVEAPARPLFFAAAKTQLRKFYDEGTWHTLYAGCSFSAWQVDWARCCYPQGASTRIGLEWEHAVPAARFGGKLAAWRDGAPSCQRRGKPYRGRRCARKASPRFRSVEGDMHNLFPAIGALNQARGANAMAILEGEERAFGSCDFEVAAGRVEPRAEVRGEIARAYLYLDAAYPDLAILEGDEHAMFEDWHRADAPDDVERRRNEFIRIAQGNRNPWIE
ncbi:MAG: endonuclease I [Myxococcales bacterium]|nr:endonuclease I [Myxococcales bacterium]